MQDVISFIKARLLEKSTWAGIIALVLGVVGWEATAVQTEQLAGALTMLIGTLLAILPDKKGA